MTSVVLDGFNVPENASGNCKARCRQWEFHDDENELKTVKQNCNAHDFLK